MEATQRQTEEEMAALCRIGLEQYRNDEGLEASDDGSQPVEDVYEEDQFPLWERAPR